MITTPDDRPCVAPKAGDMVKLRNGEIAGPLSEYSAMACRYRHNNRAWYWTGAANVTVSPNDIVEIIAQPREIYVARSINNGDLMRVFDTKYKRDLWRSTRSSTDPCTLHTYREVIE